MISDDITTWVNTLPYWQRLISDKIFHSVLIDEDGMNAQFLAHILQVMAEGGDGVALITEQALKLNDALDGIGRDDC